MLLPCLGFMLKQILESPIGIKSTTTTMDRRITTKNFPLPISSSLSDIIQSPQIGELFFVFRTQPWKGLYLEDKLLDPPFYDVAIAIKGVPEKRTTSTTISSSTESTVVEITGLEDLHIWYLESGAFLKYRFHSRPNFERRVKRQEPSSSLNLVWPGETFVGLRIPVNFLREIVDNLRYIQANETRCIQRSTWIFRLPGVWGKTMHFFTGHPPQGSNPTTIDGPFGSMTEIASFFLNRLPHPFFTDSLSFHPSLVSPTDFFTILCNSPALDRTLCRHPFSDLLWSQLTLDYSVISRGVHQTSALWFYETYKRGEEEERGTVVTVSLDLEAPSSVSSLPFFQTTTPLYRPPLTLWAESATHFPRPGRR